MSGETVGFDLVRVNHFVLEKQHLTSGAGTENITSITRDTGGLHATGASTPYLSLLARMGTFERRDLDEELHRKKSLARIRYVRNTFYILPKEMIAVALAAARSKAQIAAVKYLSHLQLTPAAYGNLARKIIGLLKREGLAVGEIKNELGPVPNLSLIVRLMCFQGLLICGKPRGGWKSTLHTYHPLADYYPEIELETFCEEEAREKIIESYIGSFGPVTESDITWWTGFTRGQVKKILAKKEGELTKIGIAGLGSRNYLLTSQLERLESTEPPPQKTVHFLPYLDPYLMGYRDRARLLDPEVFGFIYDRTGNATAAILCGGKIIGVWDFEEPLLKYLLFSRITEDVRIQIQTLAEKWGRFISGKDPVIRECHKMFPLVERTAGGFMTPLRSCR